MPSPETVARAHYRRRQRTVSALADVALRLWRRVSVADLDGSWSQFADQLLVALTAGQRAAAGDADAYLVGVLDAQNLPTRAGGEVDPGRLAGIASDGRDLGSLLRHPVVVAKAAIGSGRPPGQALAAGYANLDMIVRTQVADAGRVADEVAMAARPAATSYTRMVVGKTCARCLILAGRRYAWNAGFDRHPRCDCIHIPTAEDTADDLRTDPRRAFNAMTEAEQDRVFGRGGAAAIREGADMGQVVNARRGMHTAGGQLLTASGASRRGFAGQRLGAPRGGRAVRLMPEQILREARGNRDEALRLLRLHGYLI